MVRQLADDGVLVDAVCGVHHLTCRLNIEPLTKLEDYGEKHKEEKKQQDQARNAKARERRAQLRELGRIVHAFTDAINADLREYAIRTGRNLRGKAIAEAAIEQFCRENPDDPLTRRLQMNQ
jgi:acyl-CoA reductase-like NAD-dependent aldehyde dehydrogenase